MKNNLTWRCTTAALFAALTALFTCISIPIGPVPINLATLSVLLAGALLGARWGAISQLIYVALGAVGLPVFSGFSGGLGKLLGPTGGYIVGYVLGAFVIGAITERFGRDLVPLSVAAALGYATLYLTGTLYFLWLTGSGLLYAFGLCVFPFLPGDAAKIALGHILVRRLWPYLMQETAGQA